MGGVPAMGFAVEYQILGPPHAHGNIHIANAYQYNTLYDVAQMIKKKMLGPQSVLDYHAWLHREEPFDQGIHESQREIIESAWRNRFDGQEHDAMSQAPPFMQRDNAPTLLDASPCPPEEAAADAEQYVKAYTTDLQFIFSRVQHHFHKRTKHGYVPFPRACASKIDKTKCNTIESTKSRMQHSRIDQT